MFIPLEGENILCLANAVAIYRENGSTLILRRDGSASTTPFTPRLLAKRHRQMEEGAFWNSHQKEI